MNRVAGSVIFQPVRIINYTITDRERILAMMKLLAVHAFN